MQHVSQGVGARHSTLWRTAEATERWLRGCSANEPTEPSKKAAAFASAICLLQQAVISPLHLILHQHATPTSCAVDIHLGHQGEGHAVVALGKLLDGGVAAWLLGAKLVAGEAQHHQALAAVLAVQLLQLGVLRGEPTGACSDAPTMRGGGKAG